MCKNIIRSDDKNALEQLAKKVEQLKKNHEQMKKANSYYRKNGSMLGFGDLSEEQAQRIDKTIKESYSWERQPYPAYLLQNNLHNMRAAEQRIKMIEKENSRENIEYDTQGLGFSVLENKEDMRLQIFFDAKPSQTMRNKLKNKGFKWSPTKEAWQRLLNNNARYALKDIVAHAKNEILNNNSQM